MTTPLHNLARELAWKRKQASKTKRDGRGRWRAPTIGELRKRQKRLARYWAGL